MCWPLSELKPPPVLSSPGMNDNFISTVFGNDAVPKVFLVIFTELNWIYITLNLSCYCGTACQKTCRLT